MKWLGVIIAVLSGFGVLQSLRLRGLKSKNENLKTENESLNAKNETLKISNEVSKAGCSAMADIAEKINAVKSADGDTDEEIFDNFVDDWNNKL